jgi:hypothetical protein
MAWMSDRNAGQLKLNILVMPSAAALESIRATISSSVNPSQTSVPAGPICVGASPIASRTTQSWPAFRSAAAT